MPSDGTSGGGFSFRLLPVPISTPDPPSSCTLWASGSTEGHSRPRLSQTAFPGNFRFVGRVTNQIAEDCRAQMCPEGKSLMSFSAFDLHPDLLRAVDALGFTVPTPIQKDAIPPAGRGRDVLACAMTGSGKIGRAHV